RIPCMRSGGRRGGRSYSVAEPARPVIAVSRSPLPPHFAQRSAGGGEGACVSKLRGGAAVAVARLRRFAPPPARAQGPQRLRQRHRSAHGPTSPTTNGNIPAAVPDFRRGVRASPFLPRTP